MKHQEGKKTIRSTSRERRPCRACLLSIFSSGGHFVQLSGTILAILVTRHKRNISVKIFGNRVTGLTGDTINRFFLLLA